MKHVISDKATRSIYGRLLSRMCVYDLLQIKRNNFSLGACICHFWLHIVLGIHFKSILFTFRLFVRHIHVGCGDFPF